MLFYGRSIFFEGKKSNGTIILERRDSTHGFRDSVPSFKMHGYYDTLKILVVGNGGYLRQI